MYFYALQLSHLGSAAQVTWIALALGFVRR